MLVGDIGDDGHVEVDGGRAMLGQGVGRRLQDAMGQPGVGHAAQIALHHRRLRGGDVEFEQLFGPADVGLDGAEQAGADAGGAQDVEQDVGGRGLAVGAGDADDHQLAAGEAFPRGRQPGQRFGRVGDLQPGDAGRDGQAEVGGGALGEDEARAVVDGAADPGVAVAAGAHAGDEGRAGGDFAGLLGEAGDGDVGAITGRWLEVGGVADGRRPVGQQGFQGTGVVAHNTVLV